MKANHIPRAERLRERIFKLRLRLEPESIPYGGGNPYSYCAGCERSMIEASYAGHYKGCVKAGIKKEIEYYEALLQEELEKEKNS